MQARHGGLVPHPQWGRGENWEDREAGGPYSVAQSVGVGGNILLHEVFYVTGNTMEHAVTLVKKAAQASDGAHMMYFHRMGSGDDALRGSLAGSPPGRFRPGGWPVEEAKDVLKGGLMA